MTYKNALIFVAVKHKDHKRRNGSPYLIHLIRVASEMSDIEKKIIALLHDAIEDTDCTLLEIKERFGTSVMMSVEALTHRKGESYADYIQRVKKNENAIAVKLADISDNLADSPSANAIKKSAYGLDELLNK